jgi:hypothetical protein
MNKAEMNPDSPQQRAFLRYLLVPVVAFIAGAVSTLFVLLVSGVIKVS